MRDRLQVSTGVLAVLFVAAMAGGAAAQTSSVSGSATIGGAPSREGAGECRARKRTRIAAAAASPRRG